MYQYVVGNMRTIVFCSYRVQANCDLLSQNERVGVDENIDKSVRSEIKCEQLTLK